MAVYFNLGIAANTKDEAQACAEYFRAHQLVVDGAVVPLDVHVAEGKDAFCVSVWSPGMSYGSPLRDNARLMTEDARAAVTRTFEAWLVEAPPFRAAFVGDEAYDTVLDGVADLLEGGGFKGLFIDGATWEKLGRPAEAKRVFYKRYAFPRT